MRSFLIAINLCLLIFCSCKKSSTAIITSTNDGEMKATVSKDGGAPFAFSAVGDFTAIVRRIETNGDTIIIIHGGQNATSSNADSAKAIEINLRNISTAGVYLFHEDTVSRKSLGCSFISGFYADLYATTRAVNPGTITIDSLTSKYIKGSFNANCINGTSNVVQITNGSFKGTFQ